MRCASCQHENPDGARFCSECGSELSKPLCPSCDAEIQPNAKFCNSCGHRIGEDVPVEEPEVALSLEERVQSLEAADRSAIDDRLLVHQEGENRFVTVLFADMTSSVQTTHGLRADEAAELVNKLLTVMVESLKRYDGRIDRFLGDGVLAVFGTPHSHENDPERAILAAIEIRDAAQELGLGVTAGINSGEVFFGHMGSEQHSELTVMGPVVNLAARLQGKAEAGQIIVGAATYGHTERMFRFTDLSVDIKGIDQAVTAHRVEEKLERPARVRGIEGRHAKLIGRDREFDDLKASLTKALQGDGQILTVIGEAGVGKSRLTAELQQFAMTPTEERPTPLWIEGRCVELGETVSYWPFIDAFHGYFGSRADDDESVGADAITSALQDLVATGDLTEERMDEIGPLLGHMRSVKFGNDWDDRLKFADGQQIRHRTFHAVRDFLVALSRRQPVVLVLDDLHWADSSSIDLIALLMESLADSPIFLLCVYRPEQDHRCWRLGAIAERKCIERFHEVRLRELTPDESCELIDELLNIEDLPESVSDMILAKAHGNPFFVEEVVRSLIDSGVVYLDGDVWKASEDIAEVTVPETVQSVVLTRVDRLEAELRHVLQSASVIGRVFRRRVLERVATQASDIEQALWELEDHALIYQGRTVPEPEYVFRHALTRDAVYQTVVQRRRTEFHGSVAREMEGLYGDKIDEHVEQLAHHYEMGDDDAKAVEYLVLAGEKAQKEYAHDTATERFRAALDRLNSTVTAAAQVEWRFRALGNLGMVHQLTGERDEAETYLRAAIEHGKDNGIERRRLVLLHHWLGEVQYWSGDHLGQLQTGQDGMALVAEPESAEAAMMNRLIGLAYWRAGDRAAWRRYTEANAQFLDHVPYQPELRSAYAELVLLFQHHHRTEMTIVREWAEKLRARAHHAHDLCGVGRALDTLAGCDASEGNPQQALPLARDALAVSNRAGDHQQAIRPMQKWMDAASELGNLPEARRAGEMYRDTTDRLFPGRARPLLRLSS